MHYALEPSDQMIVEQRACIIALTWHYGERDILWEVRFSGKSTHGQLMRGAILFRPDSRLHAVNTAAQDRL